MNPKSIISAVAERHKLTAEQVTAPDGSIRCRVRAIVRARDEAMWKVRIATRMSYPEIGRMFGRRDHSSVIAACNRHEDTLPILGTA